MDRALMTELRALRKGRGVQSPDLFRRVGPRLRDVLDHATDDSLREVLVSELTTCAHDLPDDLADLYLGAAGITDPTNFLSDRLENLSGLYDRHPRTLIRRLQGADELMAERLLRRQQLRRGEAALQAKGWTFTEFEGWVRLDLTQPEFRSRRRLRVLADELVEIKDIFMVGPGAAEPEVEVPTGGTLARMERLSDSVWELSITPPRALRRDEEHDLEVVVRVAGAAEVLPYAVLSSVRPCSRFRIRVDIGDSGATDFFELAGLPWGVLGDDFAGGTPVPVVDGSVERDFVGPVPGLAYGLRWRLADS
ncbi:hypothetical protein AADG42_04160 [Ammonicoccus fulvus]|uniref:Uncharacterized protein n=1 Tax=Ammonicoccus fulvus TaxID=3138240 RepID=A0ABZ3FM99_9ACTN